MRFDGTIAPVTTHLHHTLLAVLLLAVAPARADTLAVCRVDPFALAAPPADREGTLKQRCGNDQLLKWQIEPTDPARRTGVLRARVDNTVSEPLLPGLLGSVKLAWSGLGGEPTTGLRTERTLVAAGSQLRLSDQFALQMNLGRDLQSQQSRSTAVGLWRPLERTTLFAEWTEAENAPEEQRVGARWWLKRDRLSLDLDSKHGLQGWDAYRFLLTLSLKP